MTLPLVVIATIGNHIGIFKILGLGDRTLKSYEDGSLLAVNESFTIPCGIIEMSISFGEREDERTVNVHFLVIPCENTYNVTLGRSFLSTLDMVSSPIHLKMKYHNNVEKSVIILADLCRAQLIHKATLKNTLVTVVASEKENKKICQTFSAVNLNVLEDGT